MIILTLDNAGFKLSVQDILKDFFFFFFFQKIDSSFSCKLGDSLLKCQILISGKSKKNDFKMSSADFFFNNLPEHVFQYYTANIRHKIY